MIRHEKFNGKNVEFFKKVGTQFTTIDYDRLYQIQQGKCAICKKHSTEFKRNLAVDHDHKTGKIRGLLCYRCNAILGHYENKDFINSIKNYLEKQEK